MFSSLRLSTKLLSTRHKRIYWLLAVVQILLSLLDLIGVFFIGILVSIGVRGISGSEQGSRVSEVLKFLKLDDYSLTQQVSLIGLAAAMILITKTVTSAWLSFSTYKFLSKRCAEISLRLMQKINSMNIDMRNMKTSQELLFAINEGVRIITLQILGAGTLVLADCFLILLLWSSLITIDLRVALVSILYFSLILVSLHVLLQKKILRLGQETTKLQIQTNQEILEALTASKEIWTSGRTTYYEDKINALQKTYLVSSAKYSIIPLLTKYSLEVSLILGTVILGAVQFYVFDPLKAAASIAIFIAASTRIVPSLLRLQNSALQIKGSKGAADLAFKLITEIEAFVPQIYKEAEQFKASRGTATFFPKISISNLNFKYEKSNHSALIDITAVIDAGTFVSIIGESGSGKTTLVNLILGLLEPTSGTLNISGLMPKEAIKNYRGEIAYAPQEVSVFNKSLRENIAFGLPSNEIDDYAVLSAIKNADLEVFVRGLEHGLETLLNESGNNLSGGQRQRIGIARALYTNPKLLILDEATSAVDSKSEESIVLNIRKHYASTTIIFITHRLSVAKASDYVIYLNKGHLKTFGAFSEIEADLLKFHFQSESDQV